MMQNWVKIRSCFKNGDSTKRLYLKLIGRIAYYLGNTYVARRALEPAGRAQEPAGRKTRMALEPVERAFRGASC